MNDQTVGKVFGLIALVLVAGFTLGLAQSIMTGFAGFKGGLPFLVITVFVLILIAYDYWDGAFKKH